MSKEELNSFSKGAFQDCLPHLSIDTVIFGFDGLELRVLLLKMKEDGKWYLPGGYIFLEEDIDDAAQRILEERTGAKQVFLHQFATFGKANRNKDILPQLPDDIWYKMRFASIGYYGLVDYKSVDIQTDPYSECCKWIPLRQTDQLEFTMDHQEILWKGLSSLRKQLNFQPIGRRLLPEKFTLPELQKLYEAILGKELNRGNFYRKVMGLNILEKLEEQRKGGAHKTPNLYRFHTENYQKALLEGLNGW